ncbi:MAG: UDP-N-acetylmuramoyl-L-alanyl-D-glutamate--2,6-diaminopimelate ligase [Woeseiaceae bacterium]
MQLSTKPTLDRLLAGIAVAPALPITGISSDSRALEPGNVFFACQGAASHGLDYLDQAMAAGVSAVVWDSRSKAYSPSNSAVFMIPVTGLDRHLGEIANRWFDSPSQHMRVAGVTGTNGKTTVAFLIAQCMQRLDRRCAYLGTLGAGIENPVSGAVMTTPACIELHRDLAEFRSQGAGHVAMEVSSHALHQNRVDGVQFDTAIFTNLSRDHIDYHGDMQAYGDTKARLFLDRELEYRIVNIDAEFGRQLAARCGADGKGVVLVSTGRAAKAGTGRQYVILRAIDADAEGSVVEVTGCWGDATFRLPLAGAFNVANTALVLAQLLCWGVPLADAADTLAAVSPPPGRMQRVESGQPAPAVYVDYAHTPAGLEVVLESLRRHCKGRLWCVFGCGGDRDRGKRPLMGATVARLADRAIVTNDNPRFENPGDIIAAVLAGMDERALAIPDRAAAIACAIAEADDDDIVLVAGKGHENVQLVGGQRLPFSDYETARANLLARSAIPGYRQ